MIGDRLGRRGPSGTETSRRAGRLIVRILALTWLSTLIALVLTGGLPSPAAADNCSVFTDCFGQSEAASEAALGLTALAALSLIVDFIGGRGFGAGRILFGGSGDDSGWDRALGLLSPDGGSPAVDGSGSFLADGLFRSMPPVGPWALLSSSGQWWDDMFGGPETTRSVKSGINHFFGTDVFDGDRWSGFLGELGEGVAEINSLFPGSYENTRLALSDPRELMDRYGSYGLGLWDFGSGLAVMAYDVSSLMPGSPGWVIEMNRWHETGEHRGYRMAGQLAVTANGLQSLIPTSAAFHQELAEAVATGSIANHEGLQTAGNLVVGIVDWETFKDDPSRWAGRMTGEAILEVGTGGAASGLGFSDNVARSAADIAGAVDGPATSPAVRRTADALDPATNPTPAPQSSATPQPPGGGGVFDQPRPTQPAPNPYDSPADRPPYQVSRDSPLPPVRANKPASAQPETFDAQPSDAQPTRQEHPDDPGTAAPNDPSAAEPNESATLFALETFSNRMSQWDHLQGVTYLDETARATFELSARDGKLYDANGKLFDTSDGSTAHSPGSPRAIFVMDGHGRIFASNYHEIGKFHHSSFLAGSPVAAAGEISVRDGIINTITDQSGHYRPPPAATQQFEMRLVELGIDVSEVDFSIFGPSS